MSHSTTNEPSAANHPSYKSKGDLTKGEVNKHLIRLSVPMMWGIGVMISFQLVDMYFIGRLGTEELAAVAFTFPVTYGILSFVMAFGIAMSSVVSRLIGSQDQETVQRVATHGLSFTLITGLIIALLGLLTIGPLFRLLGAQTTTLPMITDYMQWWYLGAIFLTVPMAGNSAIRAGGDTKTPALIMTFAAGVNLILDPLLIFGLLGFPRLELAGAAIATLIANLLATMLAVYVLYARKKMIAPHYLFRLEDLGNSLKRLMVIALPVGLTNIIQPSVDAFIIAVLSSAGAEAVAAYGVVSRIEAFAFIVIMGVAVAMSPIIGQNFGARRYDRVNQTLRSAIGFAVTWSLLVAVVLIAFGPQLAGLFTDNEEVLRVAMLFFYIVPITYAFSNLVQGWASAFNAMGKPGRALAMIVIKMLILTMPATYFGYQINGIPGVFTGISLVNLITGISFHFWCRHTCKALET